MTKIYAGKVRLQLELGSTATAYEPYQSSTYTTSLGQTVATFDFYVEVLKSA